jgi:DNA-binding response OmpR family regulator
MDCKVSSGDIFKQPAVKAKLEVLMRGTILLQESDSELRKVIALHMEHCHWRVLQSRTVEFALRLLEREEPDILISEFDPKNSNEAELINRFREIQEDHSRSILIITTLEHVNRKMLNKYQPEIVLHKPFDVRKVSRKIDHLLEKRNW